MGVVATKKRGRKMKVKLPEGVRKGLEKAIKISKGCESVKGVVTYRGIEIPKKALCQIHVHHKLEKGVPLEEINFKKIKKRLE